MKKNKNIKHKIIKNIKRIRSSLNMKEEMPFWIKVKVCLVRFLANLYNSFFNRKTLFTLLWDIGMLVVFYVLLNIGSLTIESIMDMNSVNEFAGSTDPAVASQVAHMLNKVFFVFIAFVLISILIYSLFKNLVYKTIYRKKCRLLKTIEEDRSPLNFLNILKFSGFNLAMVTVLVILFLILGNGLKEDYFAYVQIFFMIIFAFYGLLFEIVYFYKYNFGNALKTGLKNYFHMLWKFIIALIVISIVYVAISELLSLILFFLPDMAIQTINLILLLYSLSAIRALSVKYMIESL